MLLSIKSQKLVYNYVDFSGAKNYNGIRLEREVY